MPVPPLSIIPLYAALLAVLYLSMTYAVIRNRYRLELSLGDGGDHRMNRLIRGHGNFAEYAPLSLLLLGFAEIAGSGAVIIHLGGGLLLSGRLLHAYAMMLTEKNMLARRYGMIMTLASIVIGIISCLGLSISL